MCGIAGMWGAAEAGTVSEMTRALAHRGPDAEGSFTARGGVGVLGHRRLSIVDLTGGDQPISSDAFPGRAIVANGEIYNAPQLRPVLAERHSFRTGSDTEVALHLYAERGAPLVEDLDGMFAFALADGPELLLARDPVGIKPLYVGTRDGAMLFASELKAFPSGTSDVAEFPPGTTYTSSAGYTPYYRVPDPQPLPHDEGECARRVRTALEASVTKRLMGDVPVGAFLSGGLDSSAIAALMRPHVEDLHTFTVGVEGSPDLSAARQVADHLGTIHHEYHLTPGAVIEKLPEIIYALESYDQDLVRSAVPTYFTARLAAEHVKVVLTGEGADELFAGYRYHRDLPDGPSLHADLRRSVGALHNINLQRVDRMTMAHSLEARVPFLDRAMIEIGLAVPAELKLAAAGLEKRVLRLAVEDLLPAQIVWRDKAQFDEGSGAGDLLAEWTGATGAAVDSDDYRRRHPGTVLRSAEECRYHELLFDAFENPGALNGNVGRWAERPDLTLDGGGS